MLTDDEVRDLFSAYHDRELSLERSEAMRAALDANPALQREYNAFCRMLETVIRQGEPRLLRVSVELAGEPDETDRTLRFRIDALLRADPSPEPVIFDSTLEPATHQFAVQGG